MKPQHLVPVFILALTLPAYAWAGSGAVIRGAVDISPVQQGARKFRIKRQATKSPVQKQEKTSQKQVKTSPPCGCWPTQKVQKSPGRRFGFRSTEKGKFPVEKGKLPAAIPKDSGGVHKFRGRVEKSKGGCSKCCFGVIPNVLKGMGELFEAAFACDTCGTSDKSTSEKSKSGLFSRRAARSKSKGCGCGRPTTVGPSDIPPNPFEDDELQPPPLPSAEANHRIERRPIHRQVTRTTREAVPVVRAEPLTLSVPVAQPLRAAKPNPAPVLRAVSAGSRLSSIPYNPLRAK